MSTTQMVGMSKRELAVLLDYATAQGHLAACASPHPESAKKTIEELRVAVEIIRERAGLLLR